MWKSELKTNINGPIEKIWEILITPGLWTQVDPKHYREVTYPAKKLKEGVKGKMKTEDSPGSFGFKVTKVDEKNHEVVTKSGLPFGALTISKRLIPNEQSIKFEENVVATGPFAKLFAKKFFQKQIADTLPDQHTAIKEYAESK